MLTWLMPIDTDQVTDLLALQEIPQFSLVLIVMAFEHGMDADDLQPAFSDRARKNLFPKL